MCFLIELESSGARLGLDTLINGCFARRGGGGGRAALLRNSSEVTLPLFLSLLLNLHLFDQLLVVFEIGAVECFEVGAPNFEFGTELFVHSLIAEYRVTWVLHQIQMFKRWATLAQFL